MNWLINKTYSWGNHRYHAFLKVDKALNPYTFASPATWTGSISAAMGNPSDAGEKDDVELIQIGYNSFDNENSKYPAFANGVYKQIIDDIDRELKVMD